MKLLIIGFGNTLCGDDGLGPEIALAVEKQLPTELKTHIDVVTMHQLDLGISEKLRHYTKVIFIYAQLDLSEDVVTVSEIVAEETLIDDFAGFSAHYLKPQGLLNITLQLYQSKPKAWVVAVRGYEMDFGEGLSSAANANALLAVTKVKEILDQTFPLV